MSIIDHLRGSTSDLEKYKGVQNFPRRRIEITSIVKYSIVLFFKIEIIVNF